MFFSFLFFSPLIISSLYLIGDIPLMDKAEKGKEILRKEKGI
jgi:hypothetical protein